MNDVVVGQPTRYADSRLLKAFALLSTAACVVPQNVYENIVPAFAGETGVSEEIAVIDVLASVPVHA